MAGRASAIAFTAGLVFAAGGAAQTAREVLVVVGGGVAFPWDTEFELANGESVPVNVEIGNLSTPISESRCPGLTPCVVSLAQFTIPANASVRKRATEGMGGGFPSTLFVVPASRSSAPTVRARIFDRTRPDRSAELPVVRLSTIAALNPTVLSFPGATRGPTVRTNLVVAELSGIGGLDVLVEAYSSDGRLLGGEQLMVHASSVFGGGGLILVDVLARLGVEALDGGQIRVTKTGGSGLLWGLLANVVAEGRVTLSLGRNP